jgi:membrane associated rhomboid family serine protease
LLPLQVDVPRERLPLANWLIIAIIIAFFVWQKCQVKTYHTTIEDELNNIASQEHNEAFLIKTDIFKGLVLKDWNVRGMLGHMWLHSGYLHIIGNLLFLWIFGNAVCAKIGNIKYILVYLLVGLASAASHLYFNGGAAVGASGAINGIVGMYLVFFPGNSISCFALLVIPVFYCKIFEVSSIAMILYWLTWDIFGAAIGWGGVAYFAHLGGFFCGFIIATLLLLTGITKMCRYEESLFQMFKSRPPELYKTPAFERVLKGDYDKSNSAYIPEELEQYRRETYIQLKCECGMKFKVSTKLSGKNGKCPSCNNSIRVP